ncbi:glycosyltransferase [Adhaeribacter radiodurans]|uniref:Glycosyltransferase n=1 Tax=Adhaeribacter radiodurans TaxID=2745197 RepID=A0A7L7L431_9BACT|nr:glycosyltransferase [Adhaeribacter radiodurans]QMU27345.1 glycosyltransferase [Adhaeribacter radiodurans]
MTQKKALHINSYFLSNKIHYNLYTTITKYREDKLFIPVYESYRENDIPGLDIDYIFTNVDKKLFFTKYFKIFKVINKKKLTNGYDYIHAHTLISDGIAAYLLSKFTNRKFVVTVRSTDVDFFIKKSSFFRFIARKILSQVSMVFFVSQSHKNIIKTLYPKIDTNAFFSLPNGLDNFWLKNVYEKTPADQDLSSVKILFVGQIIKRKKLDLLIDFLKKYDDRKYELTIVGKNSLELDFDQIAQSITNGNTINYVGEVKNKEELLRIYRENHLFILLSYAETFGVVYVEALSQGLPIIYTRGDGIDGYFPEGEVGYSSSHESLPELKEKVDLILAQYSTICKNTKKNIQRFDWELIAKDYIQQTNNLI